MYTGWRTFSRPARNSSSIEIVTNQHTLTCGTPGGIRFVLQPPVGYQIVGLFGRSGAEVDALGVIARPRP